MSLRTFSVNEISPALGGRGWSNSVLGEYLFKMIRFTVSVRHARNIWTRCRLPD